MPMPPPIVDLDWLRREVDPPGVDRPGRWRDHGIVLADVRSTMVGGDPDADFAADHVPGATLVSLEDDLSALPAPVLGRHPLPTPHAFAAALEVRGIGDDELVLAYDARGGAHAGRLAWMLRLIGQPASLVDGGSEAIAELVNSWGPQAAIRSREQLGAGSRRVVAWPGEAIVDADGVSAAVAAGVRVVDSRDDARFRGEVEPIDAVAGHVPGAINVPYTHNLGPDGRFRPASELAQRFDEAGVDGSAVVYCGSGVTACHNALAVEHAGLGRPRVYVGSWSGWSSDPDRPVATGS